MKKTKEFPLSENELVKYYEQQEVLRSQVVLTDKLRDPIRYIAGTDVAYHDLSNKMVGAMVVLDGDTLEVVDSVYHEMPIAFPYIPGLFSFREIPPLLESFKQLRIEPDLIVCDAQGIAHPKGLGMASHLGLELDIPTIGCAKKRLVGIYDEQSLGLKRGDTSDLILEDKVVGKVLRTQDKTNPVFVSIGHKISLDSAIAWILKLTPKYRLPETTRQADHLVNSLLKRGVE